MTPINNFILNKKLYFFHINIIFDFCIVFLKVNEYLCKINKFLFTNIKFIKFINFSNSNNRGCEFVENL